MVITDFRNRICMQPMRQLNMHSQEGLSLFLGDQGWGEKGGLLGFFLFPSSSQCVPKDVPNSTTLLSHKLCP
jgi:hypothetical protein